MPLWGIIRSSMLEKRLDTMTHLLGGFERKNLMGERLAFAGG